MSHTDSPAPLHDSTTEDPFEVLGLIAGASEEEVRKRYLELVRQYPPERQPEQFRKIHHAYQCASDPLLLARRLLDTERDPPDWKEVLARHERLPPRLSVEALLSLGNRSETPASTSASARKDSSEAANQTKESDGTAS